MLIVYCLAAQMSLGDVWDDLKGYRYGQGNAAGERAEKAVNNAPADRHSQIEGKLIGVLNSNGPDDGKAVACRLLQRIGTERSVEALSKLLKHRRLSHYARLALERMESPKADKAMLNALNGAPDEVKAGILGSLGARRDKNAVKQASELVKHQNSQVAGAAIFALGRIGNEEAANALLKARVPGKLQRVLKDACLLCADGLVAEGKTPKARTIYKAMYAEGNPVEIRVAALQGIVRMDKEKVVPMIMELLKSDNKFLESAAGAAVVDMPGNAATKAFANELPALSPNAQIVILGSLASRKDTHGASKVINKLVAESKETRVRIAALHALGTLGDVSSIPILAAASTKAGGAGKAAFGSLSKITGEGVESAIIELAKSGDTAVRLKMLAVLGERRCQAALPILYTLIGDRDAAIAKGALKAMSSIATLEDVPKLIDFLVKTSSPSVREELGRALAKIASRADDEKGSTKAIIAGLKKAGNEAKYILLAVLGSIGGEDAMKAVSAELESNDAGLRKAAIKALGGWKNASPMKSLLQASKKDTDSTNCILAFRGFIRMINLPSSRSNAEIMKLLEDAIASVSRSDEKKLVLGALSNVASLQALKMAKGYLEDEALRTEAMTAYVSIANSIKGAYKTEAKAALEYVVEAATAENIRKRAQDALTELADLADCIAAWQVSGPYKGGNVFNAAYDPEKPGAGNVKWQIAPVSPDGRVDFNRIYSGDNRAAYLRCVVVSPKKQDARLEAGSDDGIKVWLNGNVIHSKDVGRGMNMFEDKVDITLNKGDNSLLMKITQQGGGWEACARIKKRDGGTLGTLNFRPE